MKTVNTFTESFSHSSSPKKKSLEILENVLALVLTLVLPRTVKKVKRKKMAGFSRKR